MRILVNFCIDADIIECPDFIVNDLTSYQREFTAWLYDKANDHDYWMYQDGEKHGCSYRSKAFVEWLNTFVLDTYNEKAIVIDQGIDEDGRICRAEYPKDITPIIQAKIDEYKKWLSDQTGEGCCRVDEYKKKYGVSKYIGYASVDWLNNFVLNERNEKAYVIDKQLNCDEIKAMPRIFF